MSWNRVRDLILFCLGITGVIHETVITPEADPQLLLLFAAMIGLPVAMKADERKR